MKQLFSLLSRLCAFAPLRETYACAANEADADTLKEAIAVNEAVYDVGEDGVMVVPFGEVPVMVVQNGQKLRGLQRIDLIAGQSLMRDLSDPVASAANAAGQAPSLMSKLAGYFVKQMGRPIFLGHPYHPDKATADKYPDKRLRGMIKSVEVTNEVIRLIPEYNKLGGGEVSDRQVIFHSPQWRMVPVMAANGKQEVKDGMLVFRPFSLHSAGLTNEPNIPVPPLVAANEDMQPGNDPLDLAELLTLLKEKGIIKEGDDKSAILSAVSSMFRELEWARERKAEMEREAAEMRAAVPDAANEATHAELLQALCKRVEVIAANEDTLKREQHTAEERFKASRSKHVEQALGMLITSSKITKAKADEVRPSLIEAANEEGLAAQLAELGKGKSKLSTSGGVTDELQGAGKVVMAANEQASRKRQRDELVNDVLAEITAGRAAQPGDKERAWNIASARNPQLFSH